MSSHKRYTTWSTTDLPLLQNEFVVMSWKTPILLSTHHKLHCQDFVSTNIAGSSASSPRKKATSVPDISAEQIMSDNSKIISAISTVSKCDIDRSNGSGSKF